MRGDGKSMACAFAAATSSSSSSAAAAAAAAAAGAAHHDVGVCHRWTSTYVGSRPS